MPCDRRSDYYTGQGILEWEQGEGYVHTSENPVKRKFDSIQARTGWLKKYGNRCEEDWYLCHEVDDENPLIITAWMEEIR
jgi:hypothetical protein